jgi:Alw26I/Eco31I/Esp3I family type II restriction endonuclease
MKTYTQDRRAYEDWSDGDYNLANRMMGEFHKQPPMACPICGNVEPMTADHIGPVSLGFCHSRHFTPLCKSCNSAKNNRFTKSDVDKLIQLEKAGAQVVSWHSKYIWDIVKNRIHNDAEAKLASSIMAKCHQNILNILALIHKKTGEQFLMRYLHPEYSMMDYRFEDFDLKHLERMVVIANPLDSKNKRKNQERYVRVAFERLEEFLAKDNRKNYFLLNETSQELIPILIAINANKYDVADKRLMELINNISTRIYQKESGVKTYRDVDEFPPLMVAENSESND